MCNFIRILGFYHVFVPMEMPKRSAGRTPEPDETGCLVVCPALFFVVPACTADCFFMPYSITLTVTGLSISRFQRLIQSNHWRAPSKPYISFPDVKAMWYVKLWRSFASMT